MYRGETTGRAEALKLIEIPNDPAIRRTAARYRMPEPRCSKVGKP